jgi:hypothetical protein
MMVHDVLPSFAFREQIDGLLLRCYEALTLSADLRRRSHDAVRRSAASRAGCAVCGKPSNHRK